MSDQTQRRMGENAAEMWPSGSKLREWLVGAFDLLRYRFRAGEYGLRIRLAQSSLKPGQVGLAAVRLGLACFAASAGIVALFKGIKAWLPFSVAITVLFVLLIILLIAILTVRYLGNLPRMMAAAGKGKESATRLRHDMATGMQNDSAYGQLIELYEPIVDHINAKLAREGAKRRMEIVGAEGGGKGTGVRYAAVAIKAGERDSLQSIFSEPISKDRHSHLRRLAEGRQRLMRKWREMDTSQRQMEDETGDNYCLHRLILNDDKQDDRLRVATGIATYGEIVRSCDALINEFALFAYLAGPQGRRWRFSPFERGNLRMSSSSMLRCLPWRHRAHRINSARPRDLRRHRLSNRKGAPRAADLFLQPADRAAGIGMAVVTLNRKGGADWALLGERSRLVGTYPATNHVAPAGMCNAYATHLAPQSRDEPPPTSYLETAMHCEFLEELFKEPEFENNKQPQWRERVERAWQARSSTIEGLQLTGIAFDLLNLRPEICATAVIDATDGKLNWEFDSLGVEHPLTGMDRIPRTRIVQSGAAALMLARRSRGTNRRRIVPAEAR